MKGYHYTSWYNWKKIEIQGILLAPIEHDSVLAESQDSEGVWLFRDPQESESLFGMLIDRYVKHRDWVTVELEVDFQIEDLIRPLDGDDEFRLTHKGSAGEWVYHEDEPIFIIRKRIEPEQIKLRRSFNTYPKEEEGD